MLAARARHRDGAHHGDPHQSRRSCASTRNPRRLRDRRADPDGPSARQVRSCEAQAGGGSNVLERLGEQASTRRAGVTFSVASTIRRQAKERGDAPALTSRSGRSRSARSMSDQPRRAGSPRAGVGARDRIAFLDKNGPEYFEVLFGGGKINAVNVAVNWRLAPPEIEYTSTTPGEVLFVGPEFVPHVDEIERELDDGQEDRRHRRAPTHEAYETGSAPSGRGPGRERRRTTSPCSSTRPARPACRRARCSPTRTLGGSWTTSRRVGLRRDP